MLRIIPKIFLQFTLVATWAAAEEPVDFNDQIRPLLSDKCFACHGFDANAREANLRLDTPEGALEKRPDADPAIIPGEADHSLVWQRIISDDPDDVMPPPDFLRQLSGEDKKLIRRWIEEGANYEPHWTFVPVEKPKTEGDKHPIDQLVTRRLKKEDLTLAPEADQRTLIRRLSLDLRGLSPSLQEIDQFLVDTSPDAWPNLVDRFLADPAFGERMAWPWLEAARYADTNGFQGDNERTMWPWRDWVIESFNKNLPYDDFTVWQIAGDLIPNSTFEQKLATGFLRNHAINGEGGSIPEENRVNYVMDMAETVGTVWMGLTYNCCRCHDHKYDPLTQKEYYGLTDFFNHTPVNGGGANAQTPPILAAPTTDQKAEVVRLQNLIAENSKKLQPLKNSLIEKQAAWEAEHLSKTTSTIWKPLAMSAKSNRPKTKFTPLPDQSILVTGENPNTIDYTVTSPAPGEPITAIRLDALRHHTMTRGGLARSDSGNFVLTDFEVYLHQKDQPKKRLPIASAKPSFEQPGLPITHALDDNPGTGWAVLKGRFVDRDHAAVFHLTEPLVPTPGAQLEIILRHNSQHKFHSIGRFRLSYASSENPTLEPGFDALTALLKIPPPQRSKAQSEFLAQAHFETRPEHGKLTNEIKDLTEEIQKIEATSPKVMIMADQEKRRKTHILAIGSYEQPGEEVTANTPAFLPPLKTDQPASRLDLARWLVSPDHPLTSRVTVNRLWQELFGIGLLKSPEDFGVQSEIPFHPELLDWLASDFIEHEWNFKHLVRTIVTSRTYRQSSDLSSLSLERDPANRLLARGPRFRMPSWMIRDNTLAVSGLLTPKIGGAPVFPYQPPGLWSEVTFGKKKYTPGTGEDLRRRSLYTFWRRISAPPMFFDSAKREMCEVGSSRTNSPLHALSTLNDPFYSEAARSLATRAINESSSEPKAALTRAFTITQSRPPRKNELTILLSNYQSALAIFTESPTDAEAFLSIGETPRHPDLKAIPQAALASVCLSILNTDEAFTKE